MCVAHDVSSTRHVLEHAWGRGWQTLCTSVPAAGRAGQGEVQQAGRVSLGVYGADVCTGCVPLPSPVLFVVAAGATDSVTIFLHVA